ncbi:hypothetical protein BAUCODRAFT_30196 [Baudoinia panamericana UAMH 10762]|uniref:Uncharacterized protein n=1 Tax=Baudoinia panamericana (strain UAMH 10762) TaxID=717646 RepID=M2LYK0_BAUPA|nr:uncharacterized protein BAUCODRAFT_30196 [Baudoinia panamericana UAMH 10762]EMC99787.1 hypothetical protein BAUCODRAFT_30196 [Baudoinia panamericana UAMH 10762]
MAGLNKLPQEVRDKVYRLFPGVAWIDVAQTFPGVTPFSVEQPALSKTSRQVRKECLDVFYSKNKFLFDLRGWKHDNYPPRWTPLNIYEKWITAIGDDNVARLRSLSIVSQNFRVHLTVSAEQPQLSFKFTFTWSKPVETADGVPPHLGFEGVMKHAPEGLQRVLDEIHASSPDRLTVDGLLRFVRCVKNKEPPGFENCPGSYGDWLY